MYTSSGVCQCVGYAREKLEGFFLAVWSARRPAPPRAYGRVLGRGARLAPATLPAAGHPQDAVVRAREPPGGYNTHDTIDGLIGVTVQCHNTPSLLLQMEYFPRARRYSVGTHLRRTQPACRCVLYAWQANDAVFRELGASVHAPYQHLLQLFLADSPVTDAGLAALAPTWAWTPPRRWGLPVDIPPRNQENNNNNNIIVTLSPRKV